VAITVTVCLGYFMALLDTTIVNIAVPDILNDLDASLTASLWVVNSYSLALAALVITTGRLGDVVGQRGMFVAGVAVFTAASLACGVAGNPELLIAARVVQGVGAAMLLPQGLAVLTMTFPAGRRGMAFGVWSAVAALGFISGPLIGGFVVDAGGWRWVFLINLPVGLVVLALAAFTLPRGSTGAQFRLDLPGVVLSSASLVCVCYGIIEGGRYDWSRIAGPVTIPVVLGVGVVLFGGFVWQQRRRQDRDPLVPFVLFADRNFALMGLVLAIGMFAFAGMMLPSMLYLQQVLGLSALAAGLASLPQAVITMVASLLVGKLADGAGARWLIVAGLVCAAAGVAWVGWGAAPDGPWTSVLPGMLLAGLGVGVAQTPLNTIAMRRVPEHAAGAGSAVFNTMRQLGAAIGIAASGALLQNRLVAAMTENAREQAGALPPLAREPFVSDIADLATDGLAGEAHTGHRAIPGVPDQDYARLVDTVVPAGFVEAFGFTLLLPGALLLLAAFAVLAARRHPDRTEQEPATTR
jgi:EmrB/QacA subfamily drug resistance transporter